MASGSSPGRASPSLRPGAAEAGHALGEWKGKCGRARRGDRGRARSAPGRACFVQLHASLQVPAAARKPGRPGTQELPWGTLQS